MTVQIWSGVQVKVQSALASPKTVTAITKANPGVASSTAHGYSAGDYIIMSSQGMSQLNGRVFRVGTVATDTFALEGEDTTLYDTFTSGTASKITYGTSASTLTGLTSSGGDFSFIDTTTIHDTVKSQIPGAANPATFTFESFWDVADAALLEFKKASDNKSARAVEFIFSTGQRLLFNGYIGCQLIPGGTSQDKVTTPIIITAFGRNTVYAT